MLVYAHRYLGIVLSLFFLLWFASGFVIIYTGGMPRLTEAERLQHLPAIDFEAIQLGPGEAQLILGTDSLPVLTTVMNRPAYRFGSAQVLFADSGEELSRAMVSSQQIAADYLELETNALSRVGTVEDVDQWTLGLRNQLPLEKYTAQDDQGSELYVSRATATVLLHTTSRDRLLAWLGAIPHWLYFLQLRSDAALWARIVIWSSTLAVVMAAIGFILLGVQLRWRRLPKLSQAIPHRGLMRWHYLSALVFGIIVITWAFSGLLSMEPYRWTRQSGLQLDAVSYRGEQQFADAFDRFDIQQFWRRSAQDLTDTAVRELRFRRFADKAFLELTITSRDASWQHRTVYRSAEPPYGLLPLFDRETIADRLAASTGADLVEAEVLQQYDAYYYGRDNPDGPVPPLPVLRASFNDPDESVYYIDLNSGDPVYRSHRWGRVERWLYRGLHSLDFGAFYRKRPLWDAVVLLLLTGGLLVTVLGAILGFRRLRRSA